MYLDPRSTQKKRCLTLYIDYFHISCWGIWKVWSKEAWTSNFSVTGGNGCAMDVKGNGCQSKEVSKAMDVKGKRCQEQWMSKQRDVKGNGCQGNGCQNKEMSQAMGVKGKRCHKARDVKGNGCQRQEMSKERDVKGNGCQKHWMSKARDVKGNGCQRQEMSKALDVKGKRCQRQWMSKARDVKAKRCQRQWMSKARDVKGNGCQIKEMSEPRDVKAKGCQRQEMSKQRNVKAIRCQTNGMAKAFDVKGKKSQRHLMSKARDVKSNGCQRHWMSKARDVKGNGCQSKEMSEPRDVKAIRSDVNWWTFKEVSHKSFIFKAWTLGIWRKPPTKASFSHLQLLEFEGSLARNAFLTVSGCTKCCVLQDKTCLGWCVGKLVPRTGAEHVRFRAGSFSNRPRSETASSGVTFTSWTLKIWRRSRTKASLSYLQLLEFEGGLARKLRFRIFTCCFYIFNYFNGWNLKEVSHESFVSAFSTVGNWRRSIAFCNSASADRIVTGCVKVGWRRGCVRNTTVFCSWTP